MRFNLGISTSGVGFRLSSTLVLALIPLGVLSMIQTRFSQYQIEQTTLSGIGGASLQAVQPNIDLIMQTQSSVNMLAAILENAELSTEQCTRLMKSLVQRVPQATVAGYIKMTGQMDCASAGAPFNYAGNPNFIRLTKQPEPTFVYNVRGRIAKTSVIGAGHPVFDANGKQQGVAVIYILSPNMVPRDYADDYGLWKPQAMSTVTRDGTLLSSPENSAKLISRLPPNFKLDALDSVEGRPFYQEYEDGNQRIISVTSLGHELFLVAAWERGAPAWSIVAPYLLPALTWAAALIAAGWASGRLVVQHIRNLVRTMKEYRSDRKRVEVPNIAEAPTEIQTLYTVYNDLIRTIEQDEADLQNLLIDKDHLLKEVNHRSGNSLQIIASAMRLYRRETEDPVLRGVLDGLINRVIALASTHISLFSQTGRRDVPMDQVLADVIRRMKEIHGIAIGTARKHFEPIRMPSQAAIPLALALVETISCFFAAKDELQDGIEVSLTRVGEDIRLTVIGPVVKEFLPEVTSGIAALPKRMLFQFAAQFHGQLSINITGNRTTVGFSIPANSEYP